MVRIVPYFGPFTSFMFVTDEGSLTQILLNLTFLLKPHSRYIPRGRYVAVIDFKLGPNLEGKG